MRPLRAWLLRLLGVFRAHRDGQFAEEIGAHLDSRDRRNVPVNTGSSPVPCASLMGALKGQSAGHVGLLPHVTESREGRGTPRLYREACRWSISACHAR
jgi:hypothetical protein